MRRSPFAEICRWKEISGKGICRIKHLRLVVCFCRGALGEGAPRTCLTLLNVVHRRSLAQSILQVRSPVHFLGGAPAREIFRLFRILSVFFGERIDLERICKGRVMQKKSSWSTVETGLAVEKNAISVYLLYGAGRLRPAPFCLVSV